MNRAKLTKKSTIRLNVEVKKHRFKMSYQYMDLFKNIGPT